MPENLEKMIFKDRLLVLASASPRRQQLLEQFQVPFTELPAIGVDEGQATGTAVEIARILAERKAEWSWNRAVAMTMPPERLWVLGADTVVAMDGKVFGKPDGAAEAYRMLQRLSGRTHQVITAVAVLSPAATGQKSLRVETETSDVTFKDLAGRDLARYIKSGDPFGKAGAYGIQSGGARLIEGFQGCYYNIVGLPVRRALALLGLPAPACDCRAQPLQKCPLGTDYPGCRLHDAKG